MAHTPTVTAAHRPLDPRAPIAAGEMRGVLSVTIGEFDVEAAMEAKEERGFAGLIDFAKDHLEREPELSKRLWNYVGADRLARAIDELLTRRVPMDADSGAKEAAAVLRKLDAAASAVGAGDPAPEQDFDADELLKAQLGAEVAGASRITTPATVAITGAPAGMDVRVTASTPQPETTGFVADAGSAPPIPKPDFAAEDEEDAPANGANDVENLLP